MTGEEARLYIKELSSSGDDTDIDTLIARADGVMAAWCGFPARGAIASLEDQSYTLYLDGPGGTELLLPVGPIQSVTSIEDDPTHLYDGSTYLVDSGDYTLFGDDYIVELDSDGTWGLWSEGRRNIKAVVVAGWATVPADMKHACGLQVAHWYRHRTNIGRESESARGGSIQIRPQSLLPGVKAALRPYRLPQNWIG